MSGLSLVKAPRAEALQLARTLPVAQVVNDLTSAKATDRALIISVMPVDRLPAVLLQDERVFSSALGLYDRLQPQGFLEPISRAEAKRIKAAGHGQWLVETKFDDMGSPIAWGMRLFVSQFSPDEALERLDAVLNNENDAEWKLGALQAMPEAYWALALLEANDREGAEGRLRQIDDIDPQTALAIRTQTEGFSWNELYTRVMEDREERLPNIQAAGALVLTEGAAKVVETLGEKRKAKDLLAELRSPKKP